MCCNGTADSQGAQDPSEKIICSNLAIIWITLKANSVYIYGCNDGILLRPNIRVVLFVVKSQPWIFTVFCIPSH